MNTIEVMKTYNDDALNRMLSEITPEEQEKTDAKMMLAVKIANAMKAKGWNNTRLMKEMGKTNPSEVTRWLSGTQNFTVDTLKDLEHVLDIKLLNLDLNEAPTERIIQTSHISLIVPMYKNFEHAPSIVSEPANTQTYFSQSYKS